MSKGEIREFENVIVMTPGSERYYLNLEHPNLRPLTAHGIHHCGLIKEQPGYDCCHAQPDQSQIFATVKGQGRVVNEVGSWDLTPGTLFMSAYPFARRFWTVGDEKWEFAWICPGPESPHSHSDLISSKVVHSHLASTLFYLSATIAIEQEQDERPANSLLSQSVMTMVTILNRISDYQSDEPMPEDLHRLTLKIRNKLHRNWKVEDMANEMHLSRPTLNRMMQRYYRCTPHQLLTRLRMEEARLSLRQTKMSIKSLAYQLGYHDQFAFSKAFKQLHGVSPTLYRTQLRESNQPPV